MPGFGILALRIRSLAAWRDRRLSPMGFGGAETGSCAANPFPYPPLAPSPFRAMPCNVPVFWDDHCEYRDIFKKALT